MMNRNYYQTTLNLTIHSAVLALAGIALSLLLAFASHSITVSDAGFFRTTFSLAEKSPSGACYLYSICNLRPNDHLYNACQHEYHRATQKRLSFELSKIHLSNSSHEEVS